MKKDKLYYCGEYLGMKGKSDFFPVLKCKIMTTCNFHRLATNLTRRP